MSDQMKEIRKYKNKLSKTQFIDFDHVKLNKGVELEKIWNKIKNEPKDN